MVEGHLNALTATAGRIDPAGPADQPRRAPIAAGRIPSAALVEFASGETCSP
jgi:hypothetical protein